MDISKIGLSDDTALLCHTDRPGKMNSGGNWFAPNKTRVNGTDVPGFTRNRGPMVVRLKRTTVTPAEGIYRCTINDSSTNQDIYVGIYSSGKG